MLTEGYLITGLNTENKNSIELLAASINRVDGSRFITATTYDETITKVANVDKIVLLDEYIPVSPELSYFHEVLHTPYDRTIVVLPNQLLTKFETSIWENLRGLGPIVYPASRLSYSYETITSNKYWKSLTEENTFGFSTVLNAGYIDKTMGAMDVFGLAMILSSYRHEEYLKWIKDQEDILLPPMPEYLWPEWVISFIKTITTDKIKFYDFINIIDLKLQDNNYIDDKWSKKPWNRFLKYWITDSGEVKIENFIQLGLIHHDGAHWLNETDIKNLNESE